MSHSTPIAQIGPSFFVGQDTQLAKQPVVAQDLLGKLSFAIDTGDKKSAGALISELDGSPDLTGYMRAQSALARLSYAIEFKEPKKAVQDLAIKAIISLNKYLETPQLDNQEKGTINATLAMTTNKLAEAMAAQRDLPSAHSLADHAIKLIASEEGNKGIQGILEFSAFNYLYRHRESRHSDPAKNLLSNAWKNISENSNQVSLRLLLEVASVYTVALRSDDKPRLAKQVAKRAIRAFEQVASKGDTSSFVELSILTHELSKTHLQLKEYKDAFQASHRALELMQYKFSPQVAGNCGATSLVGALLAEDEVRVERSLQLMSNLKRISPESLRTMVVGIHEGLFTLEKLSKEAGNTELMAAINESKEILVEKGFAA